jgi:hypothetical protein
MQKQVMVGKNHLSYINNKTIEIFKLYLLPPKFIDDLRRIGYMDIHTERHDVHYIER